MKAKLTPIPRYNDDIHKISKQKIDSVGLYGSSIFVPTKNS